MGEALIVNPYDVKELATALRDAVTMKKDERQRRMRILRKRIKEHALAIGLDELVVKGSRSSLEGRVGQA